MTIGTINSSNNVINKENFISTALNKNISNNKVESLFGDCLNKKLEFNQYMNECKQKYNYNEMSCNEKKVFDYFQNKENTLFEEKGLYACKAYSYEELRKSAISFPPLDAPKDVQNTWMNFISSYPKEQQESIMGMFIPISPLNGDETSSYVESLIHNCTLDEIANGVNRSYNKSLYNEFLKKLKTKTS